MKFKVGDRVVRDWSNGDRSFRYWPKCPGTIVRVYGDDVVDIIWDCDNDIVSAHYRTRYLLLLNGLDVMLELAP